MTSPTVAATTTTINNINITNSNTSTLRGLDNKCLYDCGNYLLDEGQDGSPVIRTRKHNNRRRLLCGVAVTMMHLLGMAHSFELGGGAFTRSISKPLSWSLSSQKKSLHQRRCIRMALSSRELRFFQNGGVFSLDNIHMNRDYFFVRDMASSAAPVSVVESTFTVNGEVLTAPPATTRGFSCSDDQKIGIENDDEDDSDIDFDGDFFDNEDFKLVNSEKESFKLLEDSVSNSKDSQLSSSSSAGSDSIENLMTDKPCKRCNGMYLPLSKKERELFSLLRRVQKETHLNTTLRVAGGWVRDKLLATPEFHGHATTAPEVGERLTSKFHKPGPSMGRNGGKIIVTEKDLVPVDIDIALDDMLGREFADHLNEYLSEHGRDTVTVGVVLKNPEKSKHLETATMKVSSFWIDFVNLRAEEYTQDSRIPELMRIGTPAEDAFRRDLTINALFYNINTGLVEDWTGRGFEDLRRGVVGTPLAPLTTLLDDPLRALRSVRFAARLRFSMDNDLVKAARDERVRTALAQKVSRERVGGEIDLMLRSPDPVGAMRLLVNLNLVDTVFPVSNILAEDELAPLIFNKGLDLLSTTHDHLVDCKFSPPMWCSRKRTSSYVTNGVQETPLMSDEEGRRLLWYASFLKPLYDHSIRLKQAKHTRRQGKKANRSIISKLLVDELKRPSRDAEAVEKIMKAADEFTQLINSGCDLSATLVLLSDIRITCENDDGALSCFMGGRRVYSDTEEDPVWEHAMEFRLLCANVLTRIGPLWRAALILSLSEQLASLENEIEYAIEGDVIDESQEEKRHGVIEQYDAFGAALQQTGLIGIWQRKPLLDGGEVKRILPKIPPGPVFREIMMEQETWMTLHPCGSKEHLVNHLQTKFATFAADFDNQSLN